MDVVESYSVFKVLLQQLISIFLISLYLAFLATSTKYENWRAILVFQYISIQIKRKFSVKSMF